MAGFATGVDRVLLESKLRRPEPRPGVVSRAGLIERARGSRSRVVSVIAPAGYGKSTMLAEWAAMERRAVAWVSLEQSDDDPAVLLRLVAAACSAVSLPAAAIVAEMRGGGGLALGRAAPLLAAALAATEAPFVLFVDDVHAVGSPDCRDVFEVVLGGIPTGSQVVLAGRHEQPYVARLRAAGELVEFGAVDLRVDLDGARTIFREAGVAGASEAGVAGAWERCEGWPAGLHLCALIAREGDRGCELSSVWGDDRFVADYLYRECVERLPDDLQRFLRRTAVLEQLSGAVCDAVLESADSGTRLREVEMLNLFLVPLDRRRGWYRYHGLFREFLLAELQRSEGALIPELHLRAAGWCEANGLAAHAIEHLLAAGDRVGSVRLVAAMASPTYQAGQFATVSRWISELGYEDVASYPPLAALACWDAMLMGEPGEAERWASLIEDVQFDGDSPDAERAFAAMRAMLRAVMYADGPQRALEDAAFALATEPTWSSWRPLALYVYASALLLAGDVDGARTAFADAAIGNATATPGPIVQSKAELAILAVDDGNWDEAATHADTALAVAEANHMETYAIAALASAVGARIAFRRGDVQGADRLLARAMRSRALCTYVLPWLSLRVRLQLAKAYTERGEQVAAIALAREMTETLRKRPDIGVLADEVAACRRELERVPDALGAPPLSPAELRVLPYLQTHLTLSDIGHRLIVSRNTVSTQVRSIYRKLRVNSRREAVQRATEMGLLGD